MKKTLTIILTDGPYISEYAEVAYKIARAALKEHEVNIFLYLDSVHIPNRGQMPHLFRNAGESFEMLANCGATVRACVRCAAARGYLPDKDLSDERSSVCQDYHKGIEITSLYDLAEMLKRSDRVIALSR